MGYLDRVIIKEALLDISEDDNTTQPTHIQGYEIIAVITPVALDGVTNDVNSIEIDPGNGTFYVPLNSAGTTPAFDMDDFEVDEYLQVKASVMEQKLVGARARLQLSEAEAADRTFWLVLQALPGSAD